MTDYGAVLEQLQALVQAQAPERVVSLDHRDFNDIPDDELLSGVYTILPAGVASYSYEFLPGDLGQFEVLITGMGKLAEDTKPSACNAAEFAMLRELEAVAQTHFEHPALIGELQLQSAVQSAQLEHPYYWVVTRWRVAADPDE